MDEQTHGWFGGANKVRQTMEECQQLSNIRSSDGEEVLRALVIGKLQHARGVNATSLHNHE